MTGGVVEGGTIEFVVDGQQLEFSLRRITLFEHVKLVLITLTTGGAMNVTK